MPELDLDEPVYWKDLDKDTSSRYDLTRAAASDRDTRIMWSVYSAILFVVSAGIAIIWLGTFLNKKVRSNPFNKYILFLGLPDFFFSSLCLVTCLWSAISGEYSSWEMCQFQSFYLIFGAGANQWLNMVIAWEIYTLLLSSNIRKRYFPPTNRQVVRRSLACYGVGIVAASIPIVADKLNWENFMPTPGLQAGFLCVPVEHSLASSLVFWLVAMPMNFALPVSYVIWVVVDVCFIRHLLPPQGRRRDLSVYFSR